MLGSKILLKSGFRTRIRIRSRLGSCRVEARGFAPEVIVSGGQAAQAERQEPLCRCIRTTDRSTAERLHEEGSLVTGAEHRLVLPHGTEDVPNNGGN